ncbi:hypothetical protein LX64_00013 [Chitinophaga skermanii]|uniref:Uncharacterized protein n=1 Tax=Chitinophaga skermanii TaxID=331697 RepID=A0A327R1A2_9BACT|nr:DUF6263 family protein [Chitinophaga skermanii]RAJ10411.1 hypothetical protein LX64_00013 [Chitinophaga skermanii]
MKRFLSLLLLSISVTITSQAQEYVELGYKFDKGSVFELQQESRTETYITVNDVVQRTTRDYNNKIAINVVDVLPGKFLLSFQYKELKFIYNANNRNILVDANIKNEKEPLQAALKNLLDQTFTVDIQTTGIINSVDGLDNILEKAGVAFKDLKEDEIAAYKKLLSDQFGTNAFRSWLEQLLVIYPSHGIKTGTQWEESVPLRTGLVGRVDLYWNLQHWDAQTAKINGTGNVNTDKLQTLTVEDDIQATAEIGGQIQSNYLIDRENGFPRICVQNTEMKGQYTYKANKKKKIKQDIKVPVRIVTNASYKFKRFK